VGLVLLVLLGAVAPAGAGDAVVLYGPVADLLQSQTQTRFFNGTYYRENNGGIGNFNYWWNAHGLDALADAYRRTRQAVYTQRMKTLLRGVLTITFAATSRGHVRLNFTANTGWPAGQVSELEMYAAGPTTPGALTVTPSSLGFASRTVGSTSPAQMVTLQNPGTSAASISSISASGDFAQTNGCGGSLAAPAAPSTSRSGPPRREPAPAP
jgi:hypothetical protein